MLRSMRRVYVVWAYRAFTHPLAVKLAVFAYALIHLSVYVSYRSVLQNVPGYSLQKSSLYLRDAFLHTEFFTQALIVLALLTAPLLAYDTVRNLGGQVRRLRGLL